jgi:hypothetical protein
MQGPLWRVFCRLFALAILVVSLVLLSRNSGHDSLVKAAEQLVPLSESQTPSVSVETQQGTPLSISSPRVLSVDSQYVEFAFDLTNVSSRSIRAYTIRQDVEVAKTRTNRFSFTNLYFTEKPLLDVGFLSTSFETSDVVAGKEQHIVLSVDYVEFSDGTKWGADLSYSSETSAGHRAAVTVVSTLLNKILSTGDGRTVMKAIDAGKANLTPPATKSEQWKQGFRFGVTSLTQRLKRAQNQGGPNQVERELRQLSAKLNGVP